MYTFVNNKLLEISPKNDIFLKTFNSEFSCIELCFSNQHSKPLEMEDKINIVLVKNESVKHKKMMRYSVQLRYRLFAKGCGFSFTAKIMGKNIGKKHN